MTIPNPGLEQVNPRASKGPLGVATATGSIPASTLGVCSIREHLILAVPGWEYSPEASEVESPEGVDRLYEALLRYRRGGGTTIVDAGGAVLGRDSGLYAQVSRAAGVNVVLSTGFFGEELVTPHYRLARGRVLEDFARLFYDDVLTGVCAGGMRRSDARANLIVAGSSQASPTRLEEMATQASGFVSKLADVPILVLGREAGWQISEMRRLEVPLERVIIGSCDEKGLSQEEIAGWAREGACVAFDHVGWEQQPGTLRDGERARQIAALIAEGLTDRLLLACSSVALPLDFPPSPVPADHLLTRFVPELRSAGISEDSVAAILEANPARLLGRPL